MSLFNPEYEDTDAFDYVLSTLFSLLFNAAVMTIVVYIFAGPTIEFSVKTILAGASCALLTSVEQIMFFNAEAIGERIVSLHLKPQKEKLLKSWKNLRFKKHEFRRQHRVGYTPPSEVIKLTEDLKKKEELIWEQSERINELVNWGDSNYEAAKSLEVLVEKIRKENQGLKKEMELVAKESQEKVAEVARKYADTLIKLKFASRERDFVKSMYPDPIFIDKELQFERPKIAKQLKIPLVNETDEIRTS